MIPPYLLQEMAQLTGEHFVLVLSSMAIAVGAGLPLGVLLTRRASLRTPLLGFANVMQTIPSLALFGFLIPIPFIGGIGKRTAIVALVLYALLPILRNTLAGILGVDAAVRESAIAMGMTGPATALGSGTAAGRAHHHRGRSHRHGHYHRDGHHRGRHRRRRAWRLHFPRHRFGGHHADSGRRHSRGAARATLGRRIQLDRTTILYS